MSKQTSLDILCFSPHPDDAEIFCGGLLAVLRKAGHSVGLIDLTGGELGTQGSVSERASEAKAAAEVLDLSLRENLGLADGGVSAESREQQEIIVNTLRRLRPEFILLPYWQERHPDHIATSELITKAAFYSGLKKFGTGEAFTPSLLIYYQMRTEFTPSFVVDISEVIEIKKAAINCHRSQIERDPNFTAVPGKPGPLVSSPLAVSSVLARDAFYGASIGTRYGEPFLIKSNVAINNPVEHFRNNLNRSPLLFNR